ncbi:MAG: hypothetical protein HXY34_00505 [Candidatus Thorarchaeota archaeon]|nr:hypothetical protein [Candidatus Thorarchaeota archaeon]
MISESSDPRVWFPYTPRPHQDEAITHAARVYSQKTVGLLSADCGVGKTIAVLTGYFAARAHDAVSKLIVLTRTHSQSEVFEAELDQLKSRAVRMNHSVDIAVTSMVARMHVCPVRSSLDSVGRTGFLRACAMHVKSGRCSHFWNFYSRGTREEGRPQIREGARMVVEELLRSGVVNRLRAEEYRDDLCPYEILRWCARESRVIIGPYSYMFKERVRKSLLASLGVQLHEVDLLVDEAHNLSSHVLDAESARISGNDIEWLRQNRASIVSETGVSWLGEAVDFLWETFMSGIDDMRRGGERQLQK